MCNRLEWLVIRAAHLHRMNDSVYWQADDAMCLFSTRASATLEFVSVMWDVIQWVCLRLRYNQSVSDYRNHRAA